MIYDVQCAGVLPPDGLPIVFSHSRECTAIFTAFGMTIRAQSDGRNTRTLPLPSALLGLQDCRRGADLLLCALLRPQYIVFRF